MLTASLTGLATIMFLSASGIAASAPRSPASRPSASPTPVSASPGRDTDGTCVFDLSSLPRFSGRIARLLPGTQGDATGALLADGTEVEMPPGLAAQDHDLRPGAALAVRGLAAPSLHLVRAFALIMSRGRSTQDVCASPLPELVTSAPPASAEGRIVRLLHDGDGAVNGAVLGDGTVLRVPAAASRTGFLQNGAPVYADGYGYNTAYGKLVVVTRLGPNRLQAIHVSDQPLIPRGAPPGSAGYDRIEGGGE
ncbi:hypothetical protein [Swaminathania salitolerans]|nr:hypothetical protein [Swaminathania salitolerans]